MKGSNIGFVAGTDNLIYQYISYGTDSYIIRARRAPYLVFQTGYQAKTSPGVLRSSGSGMATGSWVRARVVHHPGIKARNWHKLIADRFRTKAVDEANAALREWIDKNVTAPVRRGRR